jgi:hypothetical protein
MTATNPFGTGALGTSAPGTDAANDVTPASGSVASQAAGGAWAGDAATNGTAIDEETLLRIANVPRDVGWMMVTIGVLGVILPGIIGTPFLVAGIAVLVPEGPQRLTHWVRRNPNWVVHTGLKQMGRWLDDLERRYPRPHSP